MSNKKVAIDLNPNKPKSVEAWVSNAAGTNSGSAKAPAMKRLTIDISEDLHRKLKIKAAEEGVRMADLVRLWIESNI